LGAELYGVAGLDADIEIISLMLETLRATGLRNCFIELGHVGIFRALARMANLTSADEQLLFNALQRKAAAEIDQQILSTVADKNIATMLRELAKLNGDLGVIEKARVILKDAPAIVKAALTELATVAQAVAERMPGTEFHVDLSELRGYNYHTGIVFATYALGFGQAIAKGGRYDDVGTVFGRHRPATGFDCDLKAFLSLTQNRIGLPRAIFVAEAKTPAVWQKICELRAAGERVICGLAGQTANYEELGCDRQLVKESDQFVIKPI
jgi:ATP phosphoribosyltransferase regulatory subunit